MNVARTLVAALAVTALAVPAAQARPVDMPASVAKAAPTAQQEQDFRAINGRDTAELSSTRDHAVNAPGATAVDSATRTVPRTLAGPPTWPVNPQPITTAPAAKAVGDGGVDWTTIGLGLVGGLLAVCAVVVLTTRRRTQRVRLAS